MWYKEPRLRLKTMFPAITESVGKEEDFLGGMTFTQHLAKDQNNLRSLCDILDEMGSPSGWGSPVVGNNKVHLSQAGKSLTE